MRFPEICLFDSGVDCWLFHLNPVHREKHCLNITSKGRIYLVISFSNAAPLDMGRLPLCGFVVGIKSRFFLMKCDILSKEDGGADPDLSEGRETPK